MLGFAFLPGEVGGLIHECVPWTSEKSASMKNYN